MKMVVLSLPQLQTWLTTKLGWDAQKILELLLEIASSGSRRWEQVKSFSCRCEGQGPAGDRSRVVGKMSSRYQRDVYTVRIIHADSCELSDFVESRMYSVFYSVQVNGIWSPWAFESIVPFSDLHNYVEGERVKYTTYLLPKIEQEPEISELAG